MTEYKYVYGRGRSAFNLGENDIRYAMENTKSNAAAARFLNVSFGTYKKYAQQYTDFESQKTLFEIHKNQFGVGIPKHVQRAAKGVYSIEKVLEGEYPNYPTWKLRNRLLALGMFEEECDNCGYAEHNMLNDTVPLLLDHMDGDDTNHKIDNLRMLCLNCYYNLVGPPFKADKENFWNYTLLD